MIVFGFVETIFLVDDVCFVIVRQNVHQTSSVPIVGYSTAVVNMARSVSQYFERYLRIFHEEHVQLRYAYFEISVSELVSRNSKSKLAQTKSFTTKISKTIFRNLK